jgi:hypothetical protein
VVAKAQWGEEENIPLMFYSQVKFFFIIIFIFIFRVITDLCGVKEINVVKEQK